MGEEDGEGEKGQEVGRVGVGKKKKRVRRAR